MTTNRRDFLKNTSMATIAALGTGSPMASLMGNASVDIASKITTADEEILDYIKKKAAKYDLTVHHEKKYDYYISGNGRVGNNHFLNTLKNYNLINNKHIPQDYLINSRTNRLRLLAGLLDTDGYYDKKGKCFEITQNNNQTGR
jgi:replicative DNA helicase